MIGDQITYRSFGFSLDSLGLNGRRA